MTGNKDKGTEAPKMRPFKPIKDVTIQTVNNGWIVRPAVEPHTMCSQAQTFVFSTIEDLMKGIGEIIENPNDE